MPTQGRVAGPSADFARIAARRGDSPTAQRVLGIIESRRETERQALAAQHLAEEQQLQEYIDAEFLRIQMQASETMYHGDVAVNFAATMRQFHEIANSFTGERREQVLNALVSAGRSWHEWPSGYLTRGFVHDPATKYAPAA